MSQERKIQTSEESLNWISYNLKQLVKEMQQLNQTVSQLTRSSGPSKLAPFPSDDRLPF